MAFTKAQSRAIAHGTGPMLILAGPGSGKTLVITNRIKYLIQHGTDPSKILVITFTKAAAQEMRDRFCKMMGEKRYPVTFGTFHAIFFTILRHAYHYTAENILREDQKRQFLQEILEKTDLEPEDEQEFITNLISEISKVKNEQIDLQYYYSTSCAASLFREIYQKYERKLIKKRLLDFDDMMLDCYALLKEREDILKAWQNCFSYILIDEVQDMNRLQYETIRMLAKPQDNLFLVGDDDQSIYRFRGAKPEIMFQFIKDYEDTQMVVLDQNFRSTKQIVQVSLEVINQNKKRFFKEMMTENQEGEIVERKTFSNPIEETKYICEQIQKTVQNGRPYNEIAILFRTNTGAQLMTERLMEYNIPFAMKDGMPNLYEHWIARDLFSYLKIGAGSRERREMLRIINRPNRYISRECLDTPLISFDRLCAYYEEKYWMIERIEQLENDILWLGQLSPYAAINYIRKGIGYDEYLKKYAEEHHIKQEDLLDLLDDIQESAKPYKESKDWFEHIEKYKEELEKQSAKRKNGIENAVHILTFHGAKGLEFKEVYLPDLNEGVVPYKKAILEEDIQEERRMLYVGMTRAMEKLHLYTVEERYGKKAIASRFLP